MEKQTEKKVILNIEVYLDEDGMGAVVETVRGAGGMSLGDLLIAKHIVNENFKEIIKKDYK